METYSNTDSGIKATEVVFPTESVCVDESLYATMITSAPNTYLEWLKFYFDDAKSGP